MTAKTPAEILQANIETAKAKAALPGWKMVWLGIFAGLFIGFGSHAFISATVIADTAHLALSGKMIGALLFPTGLMAVVFFGAELFTGNNLMTLALMDKQITASQMLKNWVLVYIGNFIGSALCAFALSQSGLYTGALADRAIAIAVAKTSLPFAQAVFRGILCNILVVLAVLSQSASNELIGKIFGIWFPIALFTFSGYEHSIANMTYITLGMMLGGDITAGGLFLGNLIPVTIGNMIGGAVIIPVTLYFNRRPQK